MQGMQPQIGEDCRQEGMTMSAGIGRQAKVLSEGQIKAALASVAPRETADRDTAIIPQLVPALSTMVSYTDNLCAHVHTRALANAWKTIAPHAAQHLACSPPRHCRSAPGAQGSPTPRRPGVGTGGGQAQAVPRALV